MGVKKYIIILQYYIPRLSIENLLPAKKICPLIRAYYFLSGLVQQNGFSYLICSKK